LKYGEIEPVPEKNLVSSERFTQEGFKLIDTPGHAAHHISLVFGDYLFSGEAAGVFLDLGNQVYLRPATPVKFILEEAVGSVDRLLEDGGREICYAHAGMHPDAKKMLKRYKGQLYHWRDVIVEQMKNPKKESLMDRCVAALVKEDESLRFLDELTKEDRERELYFTRNSIQGFIEYLTS
jgi:glyoxylase-like metal-dependent hydrolase (beta-lactamase superfamily II)